jgi:ATP-dependent Clp protease protease subunit
VRCPVHTICIGEASSSAAILLAAGTKGERKATWNSRIMIHQIQVEGVDGRGTDIDVLSKEIKIMKRRLTETLARHTGQTYRKVYRDCENDKYLSAKEALDYGIIDAVVEPNKVIPELKTRKRSRKKNVSNNAV